MSQFMKITKTDFVNLATNPMWIFYSTAFPILMILILGFLTSGAYGKTVTSYDYYGVTMMIYSIFSGAMISANSFMEERIKGGNMRLMYAPIKPAYVFLSKIVASFLFCTLFYAIVVVFLSLTVHVDFFGAHPFAIGALFISSQFFAVTLGVLLCCVFKTESTSNQIISMVLLLFSVLGGLFFPVDGLGEAIARLSSFSPIKWMVLAIFQTIYDADLHLIYPTVFVLALLSLGMIGLCLKLFKMEDYL